MEHRTKACPTIPGALKSSTTQGGPEPPERTPAPPLPSSLNSISDCGGRHGWRPPPPACVRACSAQVRAVIHSPASISTVRHLQARQSLPTGPRLSVCPPASAPAAGACRQPRGKFSAQKPCARERKGNCSANFRSDQNVLSIKSRL